MFGRTISLLSFLSFINAQIALPTFQAVHKPHSTASSTGTVTFTNCGATGKNGPTQSQVNSTYTSGNSLYNAVTINTQGIQEWTVPTSDSFTITVRGASGNRHSTSTTKKFGTGAKMIGTFSLSAGEVLSILVGQMGSSNSNGEWVGCGGGGGTFVVKKSDNTALIVASGGSGGDGSGNYPNRPKPGGSSDTGDPTQAATSTSYSSGAGGGFTHDGGDGYQCEGGASFVNGGAGGTSSYGSYRTAHGGFGGGGGGSFYSLGGAGGGYQGGSSTHGYQNNQGTTAAYSYNNGSNKTNVDGANETSSDSLMHGYVIITW